MSMVVSPLVVSPQGLMSMVVIALVLIGAGVAGPRLRSSHRCVCLARVLLSSVQDAWGIATFASPELARAALRKEVIWCDRQRATMRRHRGVCIMQF